MYGCLLKKIIEGNDVKSAEIFLRRGTNPDDVLLHSPDLGSSANTPETPLLVHACCMGAKDIVELLLRYGADVNLAANHGVKYPIHFAAENGNVECLKLLFRHKDIDLNVGESPILHTAARNSQMEVVRFLCASPQVDVNAVNKNGVRAFQASSTVEVAQLLEKLIKERNDPKAAEQFYQTAIQRERAAKRKIESEICDFELEKVDVKIKVSENKVKKLNADIEKFNTEIDSLEKEKENIKAEIERLTKEKPIILEELKSFQEEEEKFLNGEEKEDTKWKECPICTEIMEQTIYQCTEGHCFCGECRVKINECPICRCDVTNASRCRVLEKLINEGEI